MTSLRLSLHKFLMQRVPNRGIFTTSYLLAEPLKKKKRIDPQVLKKREDKKVRKLEREIQRLERTPKQFKPIVELQLAPQITRQLSERLRQHVDTEAYEELQRMTKLWSIYRCEQRLAELKSIKSMVRSQKKALDVLREESPELYSSAISIDHNLIPLKTHFVKKETPKAEEYMAPDGRQTDVTKQWTM